MTTDRKKPTAGFWITVVLVAVLVGYPLSFGPACWITSRTGYGVILLHSVYSPIIRYITSGNSRIQVAGRMFSVYGAANLWSWRQKRYYRGDWEHADRFADDDWMWTAPRSP